MLSTWPVFLRKQTVELIDSIPVTSGPVAVGCAPRQHAATPRVKLLRPFLLLSSILTYLLFAFRWLVSALVIATVAFDDNGFYLEDSIDDVQWAVRYFMRFPASFTSGK